MKQPKHRSFTNRGGGNKILIISTTIISFTVNVIAIILLKITLIIGTMIDNSVLSQQNSHNDLTYYKLLGVVLARATRRMPSPQFEIVYYEMKV